MSFIDDRTSLGYALPHRRNKFNIDIGRLISALNAIDADIAELKRNNIKGAIVEVTIPNTGWQKTDADAGVFFVDVALEGCTTELSPLLSIHDASWKTAQACGLLTTAQTIDGALRVFAQLVPDQEMTGTLVLLGAGCVIPNSNVIEVGAGLSLAAGVLSLNVASESVLDAIFDDDSPENS